MKIDKMLLICGKMCMPCRQLKTWMEENNIEIETVFGEDNLDLCRKYQVRQTPTLVLIEEPKTEDGYEAHLTYSGYEDIKKYLESIYKS